MAVSVSGSRTEALREQRDRYVAKGVSVQPIFAQSAHGTKLIDVDGKEYLDFAGGIGVLNLGHTPDAVVAAIKTQADALLHSCFPVAGYAPYIDVCQLLSRTRPAPTPRRRCWSTRAPRRSRTPSRSPGIRPTATR